MPVRATVCGEPVALSARDNEAVMDPAAVGLKITEMVQDAPAARDEPQVWDCEKEAPLVELPVKPSELIVKTAVPVFLRVTVCAAAALPSLVEVKVRLVGEKLTDGDATPVPLSATVWGEPVALSLKPSEAEAVPAAPGLKMTETTQDAPPTMEVPQVFV